MTKRLIDGFLALVTLSAMGVFAIYGFLSLTNPTGRFGQPDPLALAGQLEASRNFALVVMLLVAWLLRNNGALALLILMSGLIELGDAAIGLGQHQIGMVIAPLLSGMLYLASGGYLLRRSQSAKQSA